MKVKDAINVMRAHLSKPDYSDSLFIHDITNLVFDELLARKQLRFRTRNCLKTSFVDLINEVADWEYKILSELSIPDTQAKEMVNDFKTFTSEAIMKGH